MFYDAIIIGARCAGAATAMQLARGGKRVLVLERAKPGSDTMSTHALMRGAVIQLDRWKLLDRVMASGVPEVSRTRFVYGEDIIDLDIRPAHGTSALIAPRRHVLDSILADAAKEAGAEIRYGTSFVDVLRGKYGEVEGVVYDAPEGRVRAHTPLVIGADGRRSTVARRVGSRVQMKAENSTNCVYAYFDGIPDQGYQWFYEKGMAAGAIPTHDRAHCVFVSTDASRLRSLVRSHGAEGALRQLVLATNPDFATQMDRSEAISHPIVFGGERGFLREAVGPGWALVGDAGYFKDPLTAHGITDAFRDAELLSKTVLDGRSLYEFEEVRNACSIELFELTDRIAALDWSMDELKAMHLRLNDIMKAEQSVISGEQKLALAA